MKLDEDAIAAHASECVLVVKQKLETGLPKDAHPLPPLPPLRVPPLWTSVGSIQPGASKSGFLCLYRRNRWVWMHFELDGVHIALSNLDFPPPNTGKTEESDESQTDVFEVDSEAAVVDGGDTRFCLEVIDRKFPVILLLAAPSKSAKEQWMATLDTCKFDQERVQDVLNEGFEVDDGADGKVSSPGAKKRRPQVRMEGFLSVLENPKNKTGEYRWTRYYFMLEGYTLRKYHVKAGGGELVGRPSGGHILPRSCTVLEAQADYSKPLAFKLMDSTVRLLLVFAADTEEDMRSWMDTFENFFPRNWSGAGGGSSSFADGQHDTEAHAKSQWASFRMFSWFAEKVDTNVLIYDALEDSDRPRQDTADSEDVSQWGCGPRG
jgi:hypothetical protein